jgi:type IV pilus assembly protein PilF
LVSIYGIHLKGELRIFFKKAQMLNYSFLYSARRLLLLFAAIIINACAASQIPPEDIRRAEKFYEAAYISWAEQSDNLTAIRYLTRAIEANPNNDDACYLLGSIRLSRGEIKEAEEYLSRSLELRKDNPAKRVDAQNSLGVLYIHQKRFDEAIVLLEEASKEVLNPAPWLAYGNLGWAYTEKKMFDEAITALKRSLFDQPQFCVGQYRLGQVFYDKGEYELASERLQEAITTKAPGCDQMQEAYFLLGMTYLRLDLFEDALSAFDTCYQLNPKTPVGLDCTKVKEGL